MVDHSRPTARERVLTSIRHQEPDRVPVDLGSTPSSGISAIAYHNVKQFLGVVDGETRIYDVVQQLAQPENWCLDRFGVDVLDIGRAFNDRDSDWHMAQLNQGIRVQLPGWFHPVQMPDGHMEAYDRNGTLLATMPSSATFFDQSIFPYQDGYPKDFPRLKGDMGQVLWSAFVHSPWDHASDPDFWSQLRDRAIQLRSQTDRALMIVVGCNLFEWGTFLRRIDNFLMDLASDATSVERLLDALMEVHLDTLANVCRAVGDVADIVRFGDDLGTDRGLFMSPDTYRKFFKPRHKALCDYVKQNSQMHTFLHSCGSIYKLLPDLIEAGYDIINPVQINARDMQPEKLKREFGRDLTFWGGGCDTRSILNRATPEEVKTHVRKNLDVWLPGGGFVFSAVHNILPDVPPENIVAMFEAVSEASG
jgi:uroporphyrinogen decarboxylase